MTLNAYHPFPETHWSLVHRAGFGEGESRRQALTTLLVRYEPALLSYLRGIRQMSDDQAQELLQEFIADKVLEYQLLQHAQKERGQFRALLLTSLSHFAVDRFRSRKRASIEPREELERSVAHKSGPSASAIFEASWARSLVHAVLENMENECIRTGRKDIWTVFEKRILAEFFDGREPTPYEQLAQELQIDSPTQTANLLVTAKRMYARLLRSAIAEYEMESSDVEMEIADLCRALEVPEIE
jgi:DNA-directed RNA polymerase specialized sigma24 family protein